MKNEIVKHESQSPTPASLIQMAIQKGGVDTVQLKELMDLQERWEKKEAKKEFLTALSNFQTNVPVIKKNKTAKIVSQKGSYSYKYADLGGISASIKKALNDCGLSYRWEFEETNNKIKCTCFVSHLGGHTETTHMEAARDNSGAKNDIQQAGSTQTYLQRYTLIGALGLSTASDDNDAKVPSQAQTEDEIRDQWRQEITATKTQIELSKLYLSNKKIVEGSTELQAMFKEQETKLKAAAGKNGSPAKPVMP